MEELHDSDIFKIIPKRPSKSLDLDSLMKLLFKEGVPDQLAKNLSTNEKDDLMKEQPEQNESIWNSIKNFFVHKKGIHYTMIILRKFNC